MKKGREEDARKSLELLHKDDVDFSIDSEIIFLKATINEQEEINKSSTWADCFRGTNRVFHLKLHKMIIANCFEETDSTGHPYPGDAAIHRGFLYFQLRHSVLFPSWSWGSFHYHDHDKLGQSRWHNRLLLPG